MVQAILFDLFGTLTERTPSDLWQRVAIATADELNVDPELVRQVSDSTVTARMRGDFGDAWQAASQIAALLGLSVDSNKIDKVVRRRLEVLSTVKPRTEAVSVLQVLRSAGTRLGLLSNCIPETVELWDSMGLGDLIDICEFSCVTRRLKPTLESFEYAVNRLGATPYNTIYVTDGDTLEIRAARACNLRVIRLDSGTAESAPSLIEELVVTDLRGIIDIVAGIGDS